MLMSNSSEVSPTGKYSSGSLTPPEPPPLPDAPVLDHAGGGQSRLGAPEVVQADQVGLLPAVAAVQAVLGVGQVPELSAVGRVRQDPTVHHRRAHRVGSGRAPAAPPRRPASREWQRTRLAPRRITRATGRQLRLRCFRPSRDAEPQRALFRRKADISARFNIDLLNVHQDRLCHFISSSERAPYCSRSPARGGAAHFGRA